MTPELTILSIPFICGAVFGVIAGFITAGLFIQQKIARTQKDTWKQAMKFYAEKQQQQREAGI